MPTSKKKEIEQRLEGLSNEMKILQKELDEAIGKELIDRYRYLREVFQENPGTIDVMAPEHGRTSCDDQNLNNGFGSNGPDDAPRCTRCALLDIKNGDFPKNLELNFDFYWTKKF